MLERLDGAARSERVPRSVLMRELIGDRLDRLDAGGLTPTVRLEEPEPAPVLAEPSVPESRLEPLLRVSSDVQGASVFLDRRFLGTTPFEAMDVPPGKGEIIEVRNAPEET